MKKLPEPKCEEDKLHQETEIKTATNESDWREVKSYEETKKRYSHF